MSNAHGGSLSNMPPSNIGGLVQDLATALMAECQGENVDEGESPPECVTS